MPEGLEINEWWALEPGENFWLEITGRPDIGADLKAPQFAEDGISETYSYSLLKHVKDGDVVFHYAKRKRAIVGYSVVDGAVFEDDIIWKALGSSAAKIDGGAYIRPGWKAGLRNHQELILPVSLGDLRAKSASILNIRNDLSSNIKGSLYFPFSFNKETNLLHGAVQGYLVKFPAAIVAQFEQLQMPSLQPGEVKETIQVEILGTSYRLADEEVAISKHKPFEIDPDVVDRGSQAHRRIQNKVATMLNSNGIVAQSPNNTTINFDIGWAVGGSYYIAEVKSVTKKNEEKQLRLGLGQILRYASLVSPESKKTIKPILIAEVVHDPSWYDTCAAVGVRLIESKDIENLLDSI